MPIIYKIIAAIAALFVIVKYIRPELLKLDSPWGVLILIALLVALVAWLLGWNAP